MISILVPSRGRPKQLMGLYLSAAGTAELDFELVVRLDRDDPTTRDYPDYDRIRYIYGPRTVLSECWNECWRKAKGDIYMLCGDDILFRTPDWDRTVTEAFPPDGIAYVHGDDLGGKGDTLGTHGFVTKQWTDAIGAFTPPHFSSDYNDLWLQTVAEQLNRRIFIPIDTEHMHPGFDKGEWDLTHRERIDRHHADDVDAIWRNTAAEREEWAAKLKAVMVE